MSGLLVSGPNEDQRTQLIKCSGDKLEKILQDEYGEGYMHHQFSASPPPTILLSTVHSLGKEFDVAPVVQQVKRNKIVLLLRLQLWL